MRKALIPAFLLMVAALVLGSTVFREQIVHAATTPFQNVVVTNTPTNPVQVHQVGTSTTSVSGSVGIDPSQNTVKLDSNANTVNLDSTDRTHLSNIESTLGNLKFDSSGNLETTAPATSLGSVTEQCFDFGNSNWTVPNGGNADALCTRDFYATDITAAGMDDKMQVDFFYQGNKVLELTGSSIDGADSYQLDLTHPLHVDEIDAFCFNASTKCNFSLAVLGNSTGN